VSKGSVVCGQIQGIDVHEVSIEIDISPGLHNFKIVGLAGKSVEEAKERISSAIKRTNYASPKKFNRKTVISLTPADIPKKGAHFDAAIAINYLIASKQINPFSGKCLVLGELSFDGFLTSTPACTAIALQSEQMNVQRIILPPGTYSDILEKIPIEKVFCTSLEEVIESIHKPLISIKKDAPKNRSQSSRENNRKKYLIDSIHGNNDAKRAILIALAGGHHLSMSGIPGTGKTILAQSAAQLLPQLSTKNAILSSTLHSLKKIPKNSFAPPFRSPHHHITTKSFIGGGTVFSPGEISLAHGGILFLDEFLEFKRDILEGLRYAIGMKKIAIQRTNYCTECPCDFILITAHNPCPCGYRGSPTHVCDCTAYSINTYTKKFSGPIVDRVDLHTFLEKVDYSKFSQNSKNSVCTKNDAHTESGSHLAQTIRLARLIQRRRQRKLNGSLEHMEISDILKRLNKSTEKYLISVARKLSLSARGYHSVVKVAQTITDIDCAQQILENQKMKTSPEKNFYENVPILKKSIQEALYFRTQGGS